METGLPAPQAWGLPGGSGSSSWLSRSATSRCWIRSPSGRGGSQEPRWVAWLGNLQWDSESMDGVTQDGSSISKRWKGKGRGRIKGDH